MITTWLLLLVCAVPFMPRGLSVLDAWVASIMWQAQWGQWIETITIKTCMCSSYFLFVVYVGGYANRRLLSNTVWYHQQILSRTLPFPFEAHECDMASMCVCYNQQSRFVWIKMWNTFCSMRTLKCQIKQTWKVRYREYWTSLRKRWAWIAPRSKKTSLEFRSAPWTKQVYCIRLRTIVVWRRLAFI